MKAIRHIRFVLFLWLISVACGSISNPDTAVDRLQIRPGISSSQTDTIASVLSQFPNRTQFSIVLIDDSVSVFYGAIRKQDTLRTIANSSSVFEIGSLSKVFTSTLLADLAYRKKLELDHPIQNYLDIQLNINQPITFKQLSNHTSGLPRIPSGFVWESLLHMDNPYKDYDEHKLRKYLAEEMDIKTNPGNEFQYSNIGAGILGYVLTRIEQKPYEELLKEIIFQPFGMQNSTTIRELVNGKLVTGLTKRGSETSNWDFAAVKGAGAILSTAEDLARFGRANINPGDDVLKLQREQTFTIDEGRAMALGWFILNRESGNQWYWHNGGTGGFRSSMVLDIDNKKGVVVLSNISAGHSHAAEIDRLSFALLERLYINDVASKMSN